MNRMSPLPAFLCKGVPARAPSSAGRSIRTPVLAKGIYHLARLIQDSYVQWESSRRDGFLQSLDARLKVIFLAVFLVVASVKRGILPHIGMVLFIVLLVAVSRLDMITFYRRIVWTALLFGVVFPLPSLVNLFTGGQVIVPLLRLEHDHQLWIYQLPATIGITTEGLHGMALLVLRIGNSLALSLLVLHTTSFPELIKALRVVRVPESFIMVIILSYKYVLVFSRMVLDMHMARQSRLLGAMDNRQSRRWAADRIAFLFHNCRRRCLEIFKAMIARGFEHKIPIPRFPPLTSRDCCAGAVAFLLSAVFMAW